MIKRITNNYFFRLLKVISWPILFEVGQLLLYGIVSLIFATIKIIDNGYDYLGTDNFSAELNNFVKLSPIIVLILTMIFLFPHIKKEYNKYKKNNHVEKKYFYNSFLSGIIISLLFNIFVIIIKKYTNIPLVLNHNISYILIIISTGIIGPIIEEYLFRGIVYNKLLKFNSTKLSLILACLIFSLMHNDLLQIIYTIFLGYILIKIYIKFNLKTSIMCHIGANLTSILIIPLFYNTYIIIDIVVIVLMIILYKKYNLLKG